MTCAYGEGSEETSIVGQGLRAIPGYDSFLTLKGFAQKNQTVYDIQSQQRNVLGATQFALSNGLNPFKNSSETLDIITNQISVETCLLHGHILMSRTIEACPNNSRAIALEIHVGGNEIKQLPYLDYLLSMKVRLEEHHQWLVVS